MAALSPILRSGGDGRLIFHCPGCNSAHQVAVGTGGGPRWGYNGNPAAPTFTPSILVRNGHYVPGHKPGDPCWCGHESEWGFACGVCHSFVTDGQIRFLSDCTHALAGQTVPLPPWPTPDDNP